MKSITRFIVATVVLCTLSSRVDASIFNISSAEGFFPGGQVQIKIENYENIIETTPNGTLDIGDKLRGIIRITTATQGSDQYQPDGTFQLTGIFETEVLDYKDFGATTSDPSAIKFGPSASFASEFGLPVGTMLALYEGAPDWLTDLSSVAATEADATNGSLFAAFGGTGTWGTDYYWGADGPRLLAANAVNSTSFAASLELLANNTSLAFDPSINQLPTTLVGLPSPVGFGPGLNLILNELGLKGSVKLSQASAGDPASLYALRSDDPATVNTTFVPEAASLVVWFGLLAVCGLTRKWRTEV